jgi:hypothetical protein
VLELEVLIGEFVAVNRLSASAISVGEVAALDHELLDDTVECGALISESLLAGGKSTEVLRRLWHGLAVKTHHNATKRLAIMLDVKVHLRTISDCCN